MECVPNVLLSIVHVYVVLHNISVFTPETSHLSTIDNQINCISYRFVSLLLQLEQIIRERTFILNS